ncbi:hypothetical protein U1P98_09840 [Lysinibacillus irui]|uniref:Tyr recombinase domain-containing protein n=1 Tax=Lysinibacillus irui TaxID=2998077 RepID=A0ABU5NKM2_9BACI|nr:hypothetical protein [Lysinibacillus irui]MEA0554877.1 hypothetical protein [Lysinibacillus irui]MEA0976592.1 hypothetical protein [Lysinibacillus irui]MEA1042746.1 hypothetical protein [Lysinibacillus irui]
MENEEYITLSKIREMKKSSEYGCVNRAALKRLNDLGKIRILENDDNILYNYDDIKKYFNELDVLVDNGIFLKDFTKCLIGINNSTNFYPKIIRFIKEMGIKYTKLDVPIKGKERIEIIIDKNSILKFKEEYVSISQFFDEIKLYKNIYNLKKNLKEQGVDIYTLINLDSAKFVKRSNLDFFIDLANGMLVNTLKIKLGLYNTNFYETLSEYDVKIHRGLNKKSIIKRSDVEILVEMQERIYKDFKEKYYDLHTIKKLVNNVGLVKEKGEFLSTVNKVKIPSIIRKNEFSKKTLVYEKTEIDSYLNTIKKNRRIKELLDSAGDALPSKMFIKILVVEGFKIEGLTSLTWYLWMKHVEISLDNKSLRNKNHCGKLINFKNTTLFLFSFLKNDELYDKSEKEINLALFSDNVPRTYRTKIRHFIFNFNNEILKLGYSPIKTKYLNKINVYKEESNESEIYEIEEYQCIFNRANDWRLHLDKAIEEIENISKCGLNHDKKYIDYWIYVLLHLFTGLRRSDAEKFKIDLPNIIQDLKIKDIHSLKKLSLTKHNIDNIISKIYLGTYIHQKNGEKAFIYCPETLKESFIYAIICFQVKREIMNFISENEINFNNIDLFGSKIQPIFFYGLNINFMSRKMNKTLLTLATIIESELYHGESHSVAKFLRGHRNIKSTGYYIKLNQQQIDQLTNQLFDHGFFGYMYEGVIKYLKSNFDNLKLESKSDIISHFNQIYGDSYKLNHLILLLRKLENNKANILEEYLTHTTLKEVKTNIQNIVTGLKVGKEPYFQCLFNECINNELECINCPFAIPHFYALTIIVNRFKNNVSKFETIQYRHGIQGEKRRVFNLILRDLATILEAIDKFGLSVIEMILEQEFDLLESRLLALNDPETQQGEI